MVVHIFSETPEGCQTPDGIIPIIELDSEQILQPTPNNMIEPEPNLEPEVESEPVPDPQDETVPDELIDEVLGEDPTKSNKYGPQVHDDIASRWEHIAKEGLHKDTKTELLKSFLIPENCKFLDAPELNPEIKAAISEPVYKRDKILVGQQNLLGQATACIAEGLSAMLKDKHRSIEITKNISNAGRILCELFHMQSNSRRSLIQFALSKETKDIVAQTKIEKQLFGDNLGEALKAGKAIKKTGSEIRFTKPPPEKPNTKQSLNYRGPPRRQQQRQPVPSAGRTPNKQQVNKYIPQ